MIIQEKDITVQDGELYTNDKKLAEVADNLTVNGSLYLSDTEITQLPDNLTVNGSLYLKGTAIKDYPLVHNCGRNKRTICLVPQDFSRINIGCFQGAKEEAIQAINNKYKSIEAEDYIKKVLECFELGVKLKRDL